MSPVVLCTCLPALVTSFLAIVFGHLGLVNVKRSGGALTGRGNAITGLAMGYGFLVATLLAMPAFFAQLEAFRNAQSDAPNSSTDFHSAMDNAELLIQTDNNGVAHGNNVRANELAQSFSTMMATSREIAFEREGENRLSLTGDRFVVYCQLNEDSCCFLVHVPEYRRYDDDAKELLSNIAWATAQNVVDEDLRRGDEIGVGLKGAFLYGSVLEGVVQPVEGDNLRAGVLRSSTDASRLQKFFEPFQTNEFPR